MSSFSKGMKLTRFVEIYIEKESAKVHVKVKRENGQITVKGNSCPRIRFLLLFSLLSSFYICGGLGLGGACIRFMADTLWDFFAGHVTSVTSFYLEAKAAIL